MQKTTYFPSKVWNYSIITSAIFRGILASFSAYQWADVPIVMAIQFSVGFTLLLPLYFLWIFITHLILKNFEEERTQKTGITYLAILFSIGIYNLVRLNVSDFQNYFRIWDAMSFGVIMVLLIWILKLKYEYPPVSEENENDISEEELDFS